MNTYDSYKDSGVEWIGNIPSSFDIIPIKYILSDIVDNRGKLREKWLNSLVKDLKELANKKKNIVIVSSGAIALGLSYLKINKKKLNLK